MIFRLEEGGWKLVHRQADPLAEPQPLQRSIQEPSSLHTCPVPRSPALAEPFDGGETRSWPNPEEPRLSGREILRARPDYGPGRCPYSWAPRSARVIWLWLGSSTRQISLGLPSVPAVLVGGQVVIGKAGLIYSQPDVGRECGLALLVRGVF
jgi:hypothetical protein